VEIVEGVVVDKSMLSIANPNGTTSFQVAKETKKVAVDEAFRERHAIIGAGLDPK
jgi:hypothetical protein